jgi:Fe-S-cluster containining protein
VPLAVAELLPAEATAGTTEQGGRYLVQPCTALGADGCGCYLSRPLVCRRYRCALLAALEDGEVALPEARRVVARLRALAPSSEREELLTFHLGRR